MLSVPPASQSAMSAPVTASGTVSMMMKGSTKLSNCAESTRKMKITAERERDRELVG
jgi:hypothetical protein